LTPTAKMIALDQDWLIINYKPLHVMFPDGGYSLFIERDPAIQRAHRLIALGFFSHAAKVMGSNPAVMRFLNRDAGSMILHKLLHLAAHSDASSMLSYAEIGAKFGVSRTHVRKVLEEAEGYGDVVLHGRGGRLVELRPSLVQAFDRFLADIMSGNDLLFRLALKSWETR
jgi:biotin operon repressor